MFRRRATGLLFLGLTTVWVAGCGGSSAPRQMGSHHSSAGRPAGSTETSAAAAAAATVRVHNLRYEPESVTVAPGESVAWRFDDGSIPHDVSGEGFHSPHLTKGTWTFRFDKAGVYVYTCTIHPFMKGTVTVR